MQKTVGKSGGNKGAISLPTSQERFLARMVKEQKKVAVRLINGGRIHGRIVSFDQFVIFVRGDTIDKVYKHAVSTIQPMEGFADSKTATAHPETFTMPTTFMLRKRRLLKSAGA